MDRLTVDHAYDPQTGFIVAREVIALPPVLSQAPALDDAVARSLQAGRPLIVFATADRCAPCQQYKRDALTDPLVIARLNTSAAIATHIEVDREPEAADRHLGGRAIPMTYLLRGGSVVATLRGQRSASDLLEWLDEHSL
jgi:thioredoxin-like negative regulator of GroEL